MRDLLAILRRAALPGVAVLAMPAAAAAAAGPVVRTELDTVAPGARYHLLGTGWSTRPGCDRRVEVSRRLGHGIRIGRARIEADGSFAFSRRVASTARVGDRIGLDVIQFCGGVQHTIQRVRLTVGRSGRVCPGTIAVDGRAYVLAVYGGLPCDDGAGAIGPFIGSRIDPDGFDCARIDPRAAGHDWACVALDRAARRVTARPVREV